MADIKLTKTACPISGSIPPAGDFIEFSGFDEKLAFLKSVGLIAATLTEIKQFFYKGVYSFDTYCTCDVVGYISDSVIVIQLGDRLHCISVDCFREMQPPVKSDDCEKYKLSIPVCTNGVYESFLKLLQSTIKESPYSTMASIGLTLDGFSTLKFQGKKIFDCSRSPKRTVFRVKTDFFSKSDKTNHFDEIPVPFEISNVSSTSDFARFFIDPSDSSFLAMAEYLFSHCANYMASHYTPDSLFDCCSRYLQCSDAMRCVDPDPLHATGCSYKKKLETGVVFFGKNRNV